MCFAEVAWSFEKRVEKLGWVKRDGIVERSRV